MCGCTESIFYLDENFCEKRPDGAGFSVRIVRSRVGKYVEKLEPVNGYLLCRRIL